MLGLPSAQHPQDQQAEPGHESRRSKQVCLTEWLGHDPKIMRKNLWLAVILLSLKLHLVLGHDCEIEKVERKPNQNVMETTAKCTQGKVKMTLVEYIEENKVPIIEFFCTETERVHNDREKCANKTARCKLPNLDGINRLFNQSDFDNIVEFELLFEDFQLELPGDVFTIFPNVVALELRFTDPFYER